MLAEIMEAPDQGIPEALLKKAQGIAVIPHVVKGAFGVGGRYGKGLVAERNADGGWGTPLFIEIGGGSFGFQLGVEATDVVMVFTNHNGIQPLLKGKLKIGADATATAGPVGRNAEAGTDILLEFCDLLGVFAFQRVVRRRRSRWSRSFNWTTMPTNRSTARNSWPRTQQDMKSAALRSPSFSHFFARFRNMRRANHQRRLSSTKDIFGNLQLRSPPTNLLRREAFNRMETISEATIGSWLSFANNTYRYGP